MGSCRSLCKAGSLGDSSATCCSAVMSSRPDTFCLSIQGELEAEAEKMRVSQQELLSVDESVYTPDFDVAAPQTNRNLIQKAGYLNLRK